jgi:hypothetical protein
MRYRILHDPKRGYFAQYRKLIFWTSVLSAVHPDQTAYFKTIRDAENSLFKFLAERERQPDAQILIVKSGEYKG